MSKILGFIFQPSTIRGIMVLCGVGAGATGTVDTETATGLVGAGFGIFETFRNGLD